MLWNERLWAKKAAKRRRAQNADLRMGVGETAVDLNVYLKKVVVKILKYSILYMETYVMIIGGKYE